MKKLALFIITFVSLFFYSFSSSFYTSITKIEYIEGSKTLKVSSKVNLEHLQQVLGKNSKADDFDTALIKYLQSNVKISINDAPVSYTFSSKNPDGNVIWIYYEISGVSNISTISVRNSMLIDKFPDQQNFINFIVNGQKKSLVCKKGSEGGKVNF